MTIDPTAPTSAVERVARRLAARERLGDEARWGETSPEFRDLYRGAAREVIALAQEPGAEPAGDRAALRDRIRRAICEAEGFMWNEELLEPDEYGEVADAVLAVLPELADQAAEVDRLRAKVYEWQGSYLEEVKVRQERDAEIARLRADRAAVLREAADALPEADLPFVSPMGRKQTADWLRRMADETATTDTPGKSCAHCGQPISRVIGTLAAWWVHAPGGNTVCHPEQAGSSPRATPKPAVEAECTCADAGASFAPVGHYADCPAAGARQDGVQSSPPPA